MKIGFNMLLWTPFVTDEHFHIFRDLKKVGYDGVELEILEGDPKHYSEIHAELDNCGLESTAVTIIPDAEHSPISDNPSYRNAAISYMKWAIDCASALGARLLCGPFYQPLGQFSGTGPTEEEKKRAAEVHFQASEHAQSADIMLAVEPLNRFECYFLNTIDDSADYVRLVGHPNFAVQYDTFHANIEEKDPIGCLKKHIDLIKHVHISENDRGTPGKGHVAWADTFKVLRKNEYAGWLTIEAFGRTLPELAAATCVWRNLSLNNEEVYREGFRLIREGWDKAATA